MDVWQLDHAKYVVQHRTRIFEAHTGSTHRTDGPAKPTHTTYLPAQVLPAARRVELLDLQAP
jgi:hypothetical protein